MPCKSRRSNTLLDIEGIKPLESRCWDITPLSFHVVKKLHSDQREGNYLMTLVEYLLYHESQSILISCVTGGVKIVVVVVSLV